MIEITQEKVDVLSKLYNLRGEDSIVLDRIKREIESAEQEKDNIITSKTEQEDQKSRKETELENFINDEERAVTDFKDLEKNSYEALSAIGISFDIKEKLTTLKNEGKKYKDTLKEEIKDSEGKITTYENEIEALETSLADLFVELAEANKAKDKLNALLEDILVRQNDSYNRGYVKKLLEELNTFTDEEISTLEMLILFPETGLMQYEDSYKNKKPFKISTTPKEEKKIETPKEPEKVVEEPKKEEIKEEKQIVPEPITFTFEEPVAPINETAENEIKFPFEEATPISLDEIKPMVEEKQSLEPTTTPIIEESSTIETPKEEILENQIENGSLFNPELESFLVSIGLSIGDNKEILSSLEKIDKKVIEMNRNLLIGELELNSINPILYTSINGYFYLADIDLVNKVNFLRSKGINDKNIREEIEDKNFTCSLETLKTRMRYLEDEKENILNYLYLLKQDLKMYHQNLVELEQAGITLDEKEKVNYRYLLSSKDIAPEVKVLKDYLVMIRKSNGKLALNVLNKEAKELALELDKLLETELDELIINYPDILSQKADNIIKRVLYCITNNIEIKTSSNSYMKYIYDPLAFQELIKNRNDAFDIELFDANKVNNSIKELLEPNEYASVLVDTLINYYNNTKFTPIELNVEEQGRFKNLVENATSLLGATKQDNERIYKVSDKAISLNKVERNAKVLLAKHPEADDKTIVLVSALFNLLTDEETLRDIAQTTLNAEVNPETEGM